MAMKIDWVQHYKDRIEQIDKDIKVTVRKKDWTSKNKLAAERKRLEGLIKELEAKK